MTIDEAIAKYNKLANNDRTCHPEEAQQLAEWLEKLKTIENIMLAYNANWYADEDDGVPDCEVLESIWNVIQDNGLDIDIEQDYRKGKSEGYNKAIDDFVNECICYEHLIFEQEHIEIMQAIAEQLKEGASNGTYNQ